MAIAPVPLVVTVLSALLYVLTKKAEAKEMGRIGFAVGLFWLVAFYAKETLAF